MKHLVKGIVLAALVVAGAGKAFADELHTDEEVRIAGTILCDTFESIDEILTAQQSSFQEGVAAYRKWNMARNELNQPVCYALRPGQWFLGTPIATVETYENTHTFNGATTTYYVNAVMWTDQSGTAYPGFFVSNHELHEAHDVEPEGDDA